MTDGSVINLDNPSKLPDNSKIDHIEEPYVKASIMTPKEYVGATMEVMVKKDVAYMRILNISMKPE